MKVGEAYVELQAKTDLFRNQLNQARLDTEKATKTMGQKMQALAPTFKKVGMGMTIAGGAITTAFGLAVKSSIDFNKEMANIATLIPGSTERVNELKGAIRTMAVEVGKDTGDLAQGAYQVISAFGDTADTVDILGIAAKAATAGVATTTDSINLLSAVTKGYGDTSKEAVQKVSDLAFQTVTLGQTTFPELAGSIGKVTPLAASLGMNMDELFAVMATGTGVTGTASEVSTQLRGILQSLMAPTADMSKLIASLGYESGQAMLQEKGLSGALQAIVKAAEDSGMPLQKYISQIEGQTLALALTGAQSDAYIEKLAAMRDSMGLTDKAFEKQTEGVNKVGFAFKQAKQQITVLQQEIGDRLLPMLLPLVKQVAEVAKGILDWAKEHKVLSDLLIKFSAVLGAIMVAGGPLVMLTPTIVKIMGAMKGLIHFLPTIGHAFMVLGKTIGAAMLTPPVGIIVAIITAIGLLYLAWTKNWGGIQEKTRAVVNTISGYFIKFVNFMSQNIINPIISGYETFYNTILSGMGWLVEKIISLFGKLPNFILKAFGTSKEEVEAFATDVREKFSLEFTKIPKIAEDAFKWQEPIIEKTKEVGKETSELGKEMEKLGKTTEPVLKEAKEGMESFRGATKETAEELAKLKKRMDKLKAGAESMGLAQKKMQKLISQTAMTATEKVEDLRKQLGLTKESIADVFASTEGRDAVAKAAMTATEQVEDLRKQLGLAKESIADVFAATEARDAAAKAGTETAEAFLYGKSPGGFLPTIKEAIEKHLAPIYLKQEKKMLADWNAFLDGITLSTFETYKELHSFLEELNAKDEATLARIFQDWQSHVGRIKNIWKSFTSSVKDSFEDAFTNIAKGTSTFERAWNNLVDVIKDKFLTAMAQAILAQLNFKELFESIDWTAPFDEEKMKKFTEGLRELLKQAKILAEVWIGYGDEIDKSKVKIDENSSSVKQLTENVNETVKAVERLNDAWGWYGMEEWQKKVAGPGAWVVGEHLMPAGQVPSLQLGGLITKTGIAKVERGERYIPPGKSPITRNYSFNFTVMPGAKMTKSELRQMVQYEVRPILLELDGRTI